jgi:hypothetical protein
VNPFLLLTCRTQKPFISPTDSWVVYKEAYYNVSTLRDCLTQLHLLYSGLRLVGRADGELGQQNAKAKILNASRSWLVMLKTDWEARTTHEAGVGWNIWGVCVRRKLTWLTGRGRILVLSTVSSSPRETNERKREKSGLTDLIRGKLMFSVLS